MRLVTYHHRGVKRAGAVLGDWIVDLNRGCRAMFAQTGSGLSQSNADAQLPPSVRQILALGESSLALAGAVLGFVGQALLRDRQSLCHQGVLFSADEVDLLPPVPDPPKVICVGLNYAAHAGEANLTVGSAPAIFTKFANSLVGHRAPVVIPRISSQIDYEGELAFVIGKTARYVSPEAAYEYVAGYMVFNDVSARDYQRLTSQYTAGKAMDTFAPCGPHLVLKDEVSDPHNLRLELRVNGEVLQSAGTEEMVFKVPELVAFLSGMCTLEPGDIIATGTPAGVGSRRNPPRWLKAGDAVSVAISGIGTLTNPLVEEAVLAAD